MIEDEIDGPGLKVASKRLVGWLDAGISVAVMVVCMSALVNIPWFWKPWQQQYSNLNRLRLWIAFAVLNALNAHLSPKMIDVLLRRRGLVRPPSPKPGATVMGTAGFAVPARTTTAETWGRGPAAAPGIEPVEVAFPLDAYILCGLSVWGLAAVGTPLAFAGSLAGPNATTFFLFWFGGLFASLMVLVGVWIAVAAGGLVEPTRVDAEGVRRYHHRLALRRRFVPWSAIAACRVETDRDNRGRVLDVRPTLIGPGGEPLMQLQMPEASVADQERLVRALLARLPKAVEPDGPA